MGVDDPRREKGPGRRRRQIFDSIGVDCLRRLT
jgi:hypothetical protein